MAAAPDIPTIAEGGLPGFESSVWFALFAPKGTPQPVINTVNIEVNRILKQEDIIERFKTSGAYPIGGTSEELGTRLKADVIKWAKVVKEAGLKVE